MTDIIWQQHNYHGTKQSKVQSMKHYGPEQPERIHFNVSDDHLNSIPFSTKHKVDLLKESFKTRSIENSKQTSTYTVSSEDILRDSESKIICDSNQNPQVNS